MTRLATLVSAMMATVLFAGPVLAAPECLANGQSFEIGRTTCLSVAGKNHLARCDMILNNTSWTKIDEGCPSDMVPDTANSTPASLPDPGATPSEPTAN